MSLSDETQDRFAESELPGRFTPEQAADFMQIQQRIFFYGWCIDHRRFHDLDGLFLPEAIVHYDTPGGTRGPWSEIRDWLAPALQIFRVTQHNMNNTLIRFDGADAAATTTYGYLAHFQEKTDGGISVLRHSAIYRDRWRRENGLWMIEQRTLSNVGEDGPVLRPPDVVLFEEPKSV